MTETHDTGREKRMRRLVQKRGYRLAKNRGRNRGHPGYGHYMIVDPKLNAGVAGHMPFPFSFNLDQVEGWVGRHGTHE
jgi:hypothetical protein